MLIQLSKASVEIVDFLTFGQTKQLTRVLSGSGKVGDNTADSVIAAQDLLLLMAIKSITEDGVPVAYSTEWMDALRASDGQALCEAVNALAEQKKS